LTGTVFATFGLDTFMVRELSREPGLGDRLLSSILGFKFLSSLMVIAGSFILFCIFLEDKAILSLLGLFSLVICLNTLSQSFWYYGDALQQFQVHAGLWAFSNLIKVPIVWFFITLKQDLWMVVYALIISEVISLVTSGYWVRDRFRLKQPIVSFKSVPTLLKEGWPLATILILSALYFRIDVMMLEIMEGERAVGVYTSAYKLIEFLCIIPGTVTIAALPGLSLDYVNNIKGFRESFYKTVTVLGIGGVVIGLFLHLFSEKVVLTLYGSLFHDSMFSLSILSGVVFFLFLNGYLAYVTIASNNDKAVVLVLVVSTLLNVSLNLYFIPRYSHAGAAISTLISEIWMLLCYIFIFVKKDIFSGEKIPRNAPV
jgi:O-antigen/teichoic acid export membrane protein